MFFNLSDTLAALAGGDDARAAAFVGELAHIPPDQRDAFIDSLQPLLAAPDEDTRWWAVRALAEVEDPQAQALLTDALADEASPVRQCAALGLRLRPDARALPALLEALEDVNHLVRQLAADALVALGEPAVEPLRRVFYERSQHARLQAVRALALIEDASAIPELVAALDQESALMEYWAWEGLERMGVGMAYFLPE